VLRWFKQIFHCRRSLFIGVVKYDHFSSLFREACEGETDTYLCSLPASTSVAISLDFRYVMLDWLLLRFLSESEYRKVVIEFSNQCPRIRKDLSCTQIVEGGASRNSSQSLVPVTKFEVFTAMKIQVEVVWVMTPCGVAVGYQSFRCPCSRWREHSPRRHNPEDLDWMPSLILTEKRLFKIQVRGA
jgi:hypothetical protein